MNTYNIILYFIVIIAIIVMIAFIPLLLSLITRKLKLHSVTDFLEAFYSLLIVFAIFAGVIFGAFLAICAIASLAEYVINFLFTLFS